MKQTKDEKQVKDSSMMEVTEEMRKASAHSEAVSFSLTLLQNIVYKQGRAFFPRVEKPGRIKWEHRHMYLSQNWGKEGAMNISAPVSLPW